MRQMRMILISALCRVHALFLKRPGTTAHIIRHWGATHGPAPRVDEVLALTLSGGNGHHWGSFSRSTQRFSASPFDDAETQAFSRLQLSRQKIPNVLRNLRRMGLQRKVPGVQQMHLGIGDVLAKRQRARRDEGRVVLAPHRE